MKKQTLSIFIIVLILAIALGIYFYLNNFSSKNNKHPYSEITYDTCINEGNKPSKCEKYIFTRNAGMEKGFQEILDEIIEEQAQKGITMSVKEIQAINLAGRMQGLFILNCQDINDENEEEIIGSIANKLFEKYPNEFVENSSRDSWIDIHCVYDMGWRVSDGNYGMMV